MNQAAKEKALKLLNGNWGDAIIISLVYFAAMSLLSSIGAGVIVFSVTVGVCYTYTLIQASINKKFKIDDLFKKEHFNNLVNQILASALSFLYIFLWTLCLIIPGIIKFYSYRLVNYISMLEPDLPAQDVLKKSEELMMGKKWDLFMFDLSFIGWMILCALTCGLGWIVLAPYKNQAEVEFIHAHIMPLRKEETII